MLRIGLTQRVVFASEGDERRDFLDQAWTRLLVENGYCPVPLPNAISDVDQYLAELVLDGAILTGGNDLSHMPDAKTASPQRDLFERKLLRFCGQHQVPVLGVCRGLQVLVTHHGGDVMRIADHAGVRHALVIDKSRAMPLGPGREVNSYHKYGLSVGQLPPDLELGAMAPDGSVEAVAHRYLPQWGIMWHPEREHPFHPGDVELLEAIFGRGRQ